MGDDHGTVNFEGADGVPTQPLRGTCVEEAGIFVPFHHRAKFPALLPMGRPGEHEPLQGRSAENTEGEFIVRKVAAFFEQVKKIYQEFAVIFKLRNE
jgi:hypothetical protein